MNILIVDDQEEILEIFKEYFEETNYTCIYESSPLKALEFFKNNEVDIVVLDMKMPDMTGIELAKKMNDFKMVGTLFVSSFYSDEDIAYIDKALPHAVILNKPQCFDGLTQEILKIKNIKV